MVWSLNSSSFSHHHQHHIEPFGSGSSPPPSGFFARVFLGPRPALLALCVRGSLPGFSRPSAWPWAVACADRVCWRVAWFASLRRLFARCQRGRLDAGPWSDAAATDLVHALCGCRDACCSQLGASSAQHHCAVASLAAAAAGDRHDGQGLRPTQATSEAEGEGVQVKKEGRRAQARGSGHADRGLARPAAEEGEEQDGTL